MSQIAKISNEKMDQPEVKWDRNFIMFVTAQCFSFIGKALMRFVLPLYILLETGSTELMGTILAISALPSILISPISGAVVDRIKKNRLLAGVNIITSVGIIFFWLINQFAGVVFAIVFMMLILLTADSLTALTGKSSVSAVSPPGTLVRANSILFLAISFSVIITPILGGFALGRLGMNSVLTISLGFLLVATGINLITRIPCNTEKSSSKLLETAMADIKAGIGFTFFEKPKIGRVIILVNMMFCITLFPLISITLPILITGYFGETEELLGIIAAVVGIGGIVGTLLINRLGERVSIKMMRPVLLASSLTLVPLTVALLISATQTILLGLVVVTFFLIFAFNSVLVIIGRAYFGRKTPADMIGKVMGLNSTFVLTGVALGGYLYGFLFDRLNPGIAFLILTIASALVAANAKVYK